MAVERNEIERFLYEEARLMDEHRFDEWLGLWALEDATYWIPANSDDMDPTRNVSIVYDRRGQLRNRIQRLKETLWLKEQTPRLKRIIGNIEIADRASADEVTVDSNFILAQLHRHNQLIWAGSTVHKLNQHEGRWRIKYKKVVLLNNNEPLPNMLFLL
jgi:3-phenylpropionate/cinnamic acid dioxygenase small subunit